MSSVPAAQSSDRVARGPCACRVQTRFSDRYCPVAFLRWQWPLCTRRRSHRGCPWSPRYARPPLRSLVFSRSSFVLRCSRGIGSCCRLRSATGSCGEMSLTVPKFVRDKWWWNWPVPCSARVQDERAPPLIWHPCAPGLLKKPTRSQVAQSRWHRPRSGLRGRRWMKRKRLWSHAESGPRGRDALFIEFRPPVPRYTRGRPCWRFLTSHGCASSFLWLGRQGRLCGRTPPFSSEMLVLELSTEQLWLSLA